MEYPRNVVTTPPMTQDWDDHRQRWLDWLGGKIEKDNCDVNSPSHYNTFPGMEAIEVIQSVLTAREYEGYLKGNYLKYKLRAGAKDNTEKDIAKAEWYQGELFAFVEDQYE